MSILESISTKERRFRKLILGARGAGLIFLVILLIALRVPCAFASDSIQTRIERDASLAAQGKLHEAEADLREIVKQAPQSFPAHKLLGFVCLSEKKYAEAETNLQKAVQLSQGKDPQTLFYLSQVEFALRQSKEALRVGTEVTTLAPQNPQALYAVGRLFRENAFPAEAARVLGKAHELAPSNVAVTVELILADADQNLAGDANALLQALLHSISYEDLIQAGSRFGEAGRDDLAVRAFLRAVEMRPDAYDGKFNLAFSYYRQRDFVKALDILDQIPASQSAQHADYHYLRGKVQLALGSKASAKMELLLAVQQEPGDESLCTETGLLYLHSRDFWQALSIFSRCSEALPRSSSIETGLGLTYFQLGKYTEAIDTFKKVLALQPDADAARESLCFLLYITGKPAEAVSLLEQRMNAADADYYIYYLNALALLRVNAQANRTRALNSIEEALKRNPRFPSAFFERGRIEFDAGHLTQALENFQKAIELDPAYAEPYALMARAYFKLGQRAKADQAQRKYLDIHHEQEQKQQERTLQDRLLKTLQ